MGNEPQRAHAGQPYLGHPLWPEAPPFHHDGCTPGRMLVNHALDRGPHGVVLQADVCYECVWRARGIVFAVVVRRHGVQMGMRVFGGDGAHGLPKVIRGETAIAELGSEPVGNRRFARHRCTTNKNDTWVTHTALRAKRAEGSHAGASTSSAR